MIALLMSSLKFLINNKNRTIKKYSYKKMDNINTAPVFSFILFILIHLY